MKAQSALEYLMTYGWAILIITIGLALLYTILKPSLMPTTKCEMGVGLQCTSFKLNKADASLELIMNQGVSSRIQIEQAGCTKQDVVTYLENLTDPVLIPRGEPQYVVGGNSTNVLRCRDPNGNEFTPGEGYDTYYMGKLCIFYRELSSNATHTACGSFSAPIE